MFNKLCVEDFAVLREPFESDRQSPSNLGGALVLSAIFQALVFYLTYDVAARSTIFPNIEILKNYHFWITVFLVLASILFAIPAVYKRGQKIQYLLVILITQAFGIMMYLSSLFLLGEGEGVTEKSIISVTNVTLGIGLLIFIATSIRFYILLKKGAYRKGSLREELRGNLEKIIMSNLSTIIIGCVGIGYVIQYMVRFSPSEDMFMIILGFLLFYAILFVLPEQLVILYCKFRFKSFNYDFKGYLLSENPDSKGGIKHGN